MPAEEAVDGITDQNVDAVKNGAHTAEKVPNEYPYWVVDLGQQYNITRMKIWNRDDGWEFENVPGTTIELFTANPGPFCGRCPSNGTPAATPVWSAQTGDPGVPQTEPELTCIGNVWDLPACQ